MMELERHIINKRARLILLSFFVWLGVVVGRLYYLQIIKHEELFQKANKQYERTYLYRPERGNIYDRNHKLLASTIANIALNSANSKKDARLVRMGFPEKRQRVYPEKDLSAHILGFVGMDQQGLAGIEFFYDDLLGGTPFWLKEQQDALGRRLYLPEELLQMLPQGKDIVLSLDRVLQYMVEKELKLQISRLGAKAGVVIIMEPFTGEILALADQPSFDPTCYQDYSPERWRNKGISDIYEPGSTFKLIPLAAALEEALVSLQERFYCGNGMAHFGGMVIHDIHPYGWLSLVDVISHSSNIGTIQVSQRLGNNQLYHYIRKFGFGAKTGIDLPGESPGIFRSLKNWSKTSLPAITLGQEIGVTPIQLLRAYAAIANGGYLVKPKIVRAIIGRGQAKEAPPPWAPRKLLSYATCEKVTSILIHAVEEGTGKKASLSDYTVAGKTGTAQKYDPITKSYSTERVVASFVGFVPAYRPRVVILVILDEPREESLGGIVAAPVFREIAKQVLRYLRVPPDRVKTQGLMLKAQN